MRSTGTKKPAMPRVCARKSNIRLRNVIETCCCFIQVLEGKEQEGRAPGELCWTTIPVGDVERAARFYSEVFDWKFERWGPTTTFTTPSLAGKHSGHLEESKERLTFPLPWVNVSDIGAALKKIKSAGGEIVEKESNIDPEGKVGLQAVFKDTEGNLLKLYRHSEKK